MRVKVAEIAWHETQRVLSVDTDGAGRLASGGADGAVCVWSYKWPTSAAHPTVACLAHLAARHTKPVNVVRFAPSGEYLASGGDGAPPSRRVHSHRRRVQRGSNTSTHYTAGLIRAALAR